MSSSREYLDMDNSKSGSTITFRGNTGFFISKITAAVLAIFFIGSLVAVGLLVFYFAPCPNGQVVDGGDSSARTSGREEIVSDKTTKTPEISGLTTETPGEGGAAEESPKPKRSVLLPTSLLPVHYAVELQPFLPPGNFSIAGKMTLVFKVISTPTDNITLHINNITVFRETVRVTGGSAENPKSIAITGFEEDKELQFFIVKLKENQLQKGQEYNVSIIFQAYLQDGLAGFYRSSYTDPEGMKRWVATTQFQPTDARRAFPCMDEPGLKATFDIILVRNKNMTSISNMPIRITESRDNDWDADIYQTTVKMSTYLLAFVVSDFQSREVVTSENITFRVWARGSAINQTEYSIRIGPQILNFYEEYFNVSFPLPKMDMIALTDFQAGAMENWGLITYRENAMLWDPTISSPSNKQRVATVIAHELAHQWFGNLVTPKWWDDLWLNEGFASYVELLGANHVEPTWKMLQQAIVLSLHEAMELDSLESSHPVSVPVNNPDEINEIFDQISYNKGSSIIRMMIFFLGENVFRKGVENYLKDLKYGNAVQDDLWEHLSKASNVIGIKVNVKEVMDSWTLQTGYPVLKVVRNYDNQGVHLEQHRFLLATNDSKNSTTKWHIPITYTSMSEKNFNQTLPQKWMKKEDEHIMLGKEDGVPMSNEWIIFNLRETGYYKVNYDTENWKLLVSQMDKDHLAIVEENRAQLVDDALDLARANLLDYTIALNLTTYLMKETEYIPWAAATDNFYFLDRMLRVTAAYGNWKKFMLSLVTQTYEKIGFEDSPDDSHLDRLNRVTFISTACKYGYEPCINKSLGLYKKWMSSPEENIISSNVKAVVSCNAIRYGSIEEWDFAWERYKKSNVASEKNTMLSVMGCSLEPWILGRYLNWSLDSSSGIRKQDSASVFSSVASNTIGRYIAFDFLRDRWAKIKEMHGSGFFAISNMIKAVTASLNTPFELQQLKEFTKANNNALGTGKRTFQQAIEETQANVAWLQKHYSTVSEWLSDYVKALGS